MEFINNPKYPQYPPRYIVYRRGGQLSDIVIEIVRRKGDKEEVISNLDEPVKKGDHLVALTSGYHGVLDWVLSHRWIVAVVMLASALGSWWLVGTAKSELARRLLSAVR